MKRMVYTERAETAAVLCGTSHKYTTSVDIQKRTKKRFTHVESHASAVSARVWRIALYFKSDQQTSKPMAEPGVPVFGGRMW